MQYSTIEELPTHIKEYLPVNAQKIYKTAYNKAWKRYSDPFCNETTKARRKFAERVAWHTVKYKYERVI